ncbi:DUF2490 domain-containing protein [Leptolyngbya sp. 7M]|uniref:DUF2490 domain-containing protein n=1 Tax=Leptolyngbya sp. 7M TaxID=2812896 RepID=UPI001B8CC637|nr:DUF2490 domain-containing protein [Leptolyngbya sp. 7M]QYO66911.1 DUF2490 domain-containing protein [Leptolyngbya sp. 7M]
MRDKDPKGEKKVRMSLLFFGALRLGQQRAYPVDKRLGAGFEIRLNDNFSFSPTYLYRAAEPVRNREEFEHRVRFDLTYHRKWKSFAIKDRGRIEYRIRNSRSDIVRFRNKFTFSIPIKSEGKELFSTFVSSEPYYDFSARKWTSHEFNAGITAKLNSSVSTEIFYLHRNNTGNTLKHINGIGANLKIVID